jgi:hypothetical protein
LGIEIEYPGTSPKQARFHDLTPDIHPPNGPEGNVTENSVRKNPVRADHTRLTGKIADYKPRQKMVSQESGEVCGVSRPAAESSFVIETRYWNSSRNPVILFF